MKIAVSLSAHKSELCIIDQCLNYFTVGEVDVIVMHLNAAARLDVILLMRLIEMLPVLRGRVFINPFRITLTKHDGQHYWMVKTLHRAHISNFNYLVNLYPFDTFCLDASNSLLVKKGLQQYVSAGGNAIDFNVPRPGFGGCWIENIRNDPLWHLCKHDPKFSQHEGTFFDKAVFARLCRSAVEFELVLQQNLISDANLKDFGREEWLLCHCYRTLFGEHGTRTPYIYLRYKPHFLFWEPDEIRAVLDNGGADLPADKFGIKRIGRHINDPLRKLIGNHFNYRRELASAADKLEIDQTMEP